MANARVRRGRKTQDLLRDWFRAHGWTGVESRAASLAGTDLFGMPGWAPEVKATAQQSFTGMLKQARANADGQVPFVVYRPQSYGPEKIGQWLVVFDLETATRLMRIVEGWDGEVSLESPA